MITPTCQAPAWRALRALLPAALLLAEGQAADRQGGSALKLSAPKDYQVQQRSGAAGGTLVIAGSVTSAEGEGRIVEVRLAGASPAEAADWRKAAELPAGGKDFRGELGAPAGGWYRMEARLRRAEAVEATAVVEHVGVGEVFLVAGQSNSANHGEERQRSKTGLVAALADGGWQPADDPQPGASGGGGSFLPPFADAMVERFHVPVGLIAAGVGATSVREWLPRGVRFPNPPTLTGNVTRLPGGDWESSGALFEALVRRMRQAGPHGFRAVLWHQGESDAHQSDPSRTLSGELYQRFLERVIVESRKEAGWEAPWFVAQASYHTPDDPGSPEIRAAQKALWDSGVALAGPDSDALVGDLREAGGKGVHFSGPGLREHGARWAALVGPWLERELAKEPGPTTAAPAKPAGAPARIQLPGVENFVVEGRPAFLFPPPPARRATPQPWIFYAPTLAPYPDEAERWMQEQFVAAGVAVAGVDVGEAYGSPASLAIFDALYRELTGRRGFAAKPCLLGRSRGGLWVSAWALAHPDRVAGIAGIYPVLDFRSYPGLTNAAPAYGLTPAELAARADEFNPIARIARLARAGIPVTLIQGDADVVVPLEPNSGELVRRYTEAGAGSLATLIVLPGQGHNYFEGFFHSRPLIDFAIARARAGAAGGRGGP